MRKSQSTVTAVTLFPVTEITRWHGLPILAPEPRSNVPKYEIEVKHAETGPSLPRHTSRGAAGPPRDVDKRAVVSGGRRAGCAPDQRHRDRRGDGCRSGRLLCYPPQTLPPPQGGRRPKPPPIRHVPLPGAGR